MVTTKTVAMPRRDLVSTLIGAVGAGTAASLLSKAAHADWLPSNVVVVDTVLGAAPPATRTGDLATHSSADLGTSVLVAIARGCLSANDGGGGVFIWDPSGGTDDGGTIIVPTSTNGTGCWRRVFDGALNVRWFGATGSGTTADETAIQNAYKAALTVGGSEGGGLAGSATVYFPAGSYLIYSMITIGDAAHNNFSTINTIGDGAVRTAIVYVGWQGSPLPSWPANTAFQYWCVKQARMVGLSFSTEGSYTSGRNQTIGVLLTGPSTGGTESSDLYFEDCGWQGFYRGVEAGSSGDNNASEVHFMNCVFESNYDGIGIWGGGNCTNFWFHGCAFYGNQNYGANLGNAVGVCFFGGTSTGNGVATIGITSSPFPYVLQVIGFRFELGQNEMAIGQGVASAPSQGALTPIPSTLGNVCQSLIVESCIFVSAALNPDTSGPEIPSYPVIGTAFTAIIRGCQFGFMLSSYAGLGWNGLGWLTYDCGYGNGPSLSLEMSGNTIQGATPFYLNPGNGGSSGLQYSLSGNYYNGTMNGSQTGQLVWGAGFGGEMMVDDVMHSSSPSPAFAGTGTLAITFPAPPYGLPDSFIQRENTNYLVSICPKDNVAPGETFWVPSATKTTAGFTVMSSNSTSTATIDWIVYR
jgi:hypothetical protein